MPICPKCSATIHHGAEDQCPACGYNIGQADEIFGYGQVEFTRVVDAAGALKHQERMELMHMLERLERRIRPVALCIYITDVGQAQELRTHAHWILNHARIHHPSFGKRELHKAIEDAELRVRKPDETRPDDEPQAGWLASAWQAVRDYVMDALHPLPPPVRQEWMLVLVLDVQLEMACFSWGYKLDPFVDEDLINTSIRDAKLQFRERATVTALKRVMRKVVTDIATNSHAVNRKLRKMRKMAMLAAMLGCMLSGSALAEPETPAPTPPLPEARGETPAAGDLPHWRANDYRHLMAGELITGYVSLFPAKPTPEEIKAEKARLKELQRLKREQRRNQKSRTPRPRPLEKPEESDSKIPGRYFDQYTQPAPDSALNDPQHLFTTVEQEDVKHVLRTLNANANFSIYVSVVKGSQKIPSELSVDTLVTTTAQPCEYAILLRYPVGKPEAIELGYQEIKPSDDQRHEWLQEVRAAARDDSATGLMEALRCLSRLITPLSADFKPISADSGAKVPHISIDFKESTKPKKVSTKQKLQEMMNNPEQFYPYLTQGILVLLILGIILLVRWLRSSSRLEDSESDIRLGSPYGAGVSRYVRYLEGTEASKEKRLF